MGDGTYIGRFATMACDHVSIRRHVLISDRVFIGDTLHRFDRTDLPIKEQYQISRGPVVIGDGSWIAIGAWILPNVRIGKNCVIRAGSVVTNDVRHYFIAAGNPACTLRTLIPCR
jgi:acetyltransferase-like isoleucine patch superfamily enzyme